MIKKNHHSPCKNTHVAFSLEFLTWKQVRLWRVAASKRHKSVSRPLEVEGVYVFYISVRTLHIERQRKALKGSSLSFFGNMIENIPSEIRINKGVWESSPSSCHPATVYLTWAVISERALTNFTSLFEPVSSTRLHDSCHVTGEEGITDTAVLPSLTSMRKHADTLSLSEVLGYVAKISSGSDSGKSCGLWPC